MTTFNSSKLPKAKSGRNSILELIKFAFAFMVLKGHGFTPLATFATAECNSAWFGSAGVGVEFFYVVFGWFIINGIIRHREKQGHLGLYRSTWSLFVSRIKSFLIPVLIPGLLINISLLFLDGKGAVHGITLMHYFVHYLILVNIIYYIIYYKVKDEHKQLLITVWMCAISMAITFVLKGLAFGKILNLEILQLPRALAFISLGMLGSKIPKLDTKKWVCWLICVLTVAASMTIVTLPFYDIIKDGCNVIMYPALVYACMLVTFKFKPFDYLGSLSRGVYLWQNFGSFFESVGIVASVAFLQNKWFLMCVILVLAIGEDAIRRIIKAKKAKSNVAVVPTKNNNFYLEAKWFYVLFICLSVGLLGSVVGYSLYGLSTNGFNFSNMEWFYKDGRVTYNCAIIWTLFWLSPITVLLAVNWKKQNKILSKQKQ